MAKRLGGVLLLCLLAHALSVTMLDEQAELGSETLVHQLDDIFDGSTGGDLGEGADIQEDVEAKPAAKAPPLPPLSRKRVSFHFKKEQSRSDLGESPKVSAADGGDRARRMLRLGNILQTMKTGDSSRDTAVETLNEALHTKLLMDELHPHTGSFSKSSAQPQDELGEDHSDEHLESFKKLIHEHTKNMAEITKFLLERKKMGKPLTTKEDSELQKFYYNRASTILKKIVLLKTGEQPPSENDGSGEEKQMLGRDTAEDDLSQDRSDAEIERLRFDAKVANANAAYNNKMLAAKKSRMAAALQSRESAYDASAKAEHQKEKYDQKVATAETKYNKALSDELMKEKKLAELRVQGAAEQKQQADVAAEKATAEADAADKEAAEAEKEAEAAEKRAEELEATAQAEGKTVPKVGDVPKNIPLSITPRSNSKALLRYLQTTLDNHIKISHLDKQMLQGWFLKQGSAFLSQLAQVDPDATWHSKGVMREEQFEMDNKKPDKLSKEWGSKHLQGATVMHDFMSDLLNPHQSKITLQRPQHMQAVNIFGNPQKIPLKFAPDMSRPVLTEPTMENDLGETEDDSQTQHAGAMSAMMGIMDEESE